MPTEQEKREDKVMEVYQHFYSNVGQEQNIGLIASNLTLAYFMYDVSYEINRSVK